MTRPTPAEMEEAREVLGFFDKGKLAKLNAMYRQHGQQPGVLDSLRAQLPGALAAQGVHDLSGDALLEAFLEQARRG